MGRAGQSSCPPHRCSSWALNWSVGTPKGSDSSRHPGRQLCSLGCSVKGERLKQTETHTSALKRFGYFCPLARIEVPGKPRTFLASPLESSSLSGQFFTFHITTQRNWLCPPQGPQRAAAGFLSGAPHLPTSDLFHWRLGFLHQP